MSRLPFLLSTTWRNLPHATQITKYVLGLSGGVDSLSLLHWLVHEALLGDKIVAVYVNHQLRDRVEEEIEFLTDLTQSWRVHFTTRAVDVPANAKDEKRTIEEAGRHARYRQLALVANEVGATHVVTGHHADDQVETILFNLMRGAGPRGLRGMSVVAPYPLPEFSSLQLLRPMLGISRADIIAYASEHELEPLEDLSNADVRFTRNRIRHELIPHLETFNPRIREGLLRMADVIAEDYALLEVIYAAAWEKHLLSKEPGMVSVDLNGWLSEPPAVQRALLRRVVIQLAGKAENLSVELIDLARTIISGQQVGKIAQLGNGVEIRVGYDSFSGSLIGTDSGKDRYPQLNDGPIPISSAEMAEYRLNGNWRLIVTPSQNEEINWQAVSTNPNVEYVSLPTSASLLIRTRIEGERFIPYGMTGHVKLKGLMIDRKMPEIARANWPIVADDDGILWVVGHRLADRAAVSLDGANRQILKLELMQAISETELD